MPTLMRSLRATVALVLVLTSACTTLRGRSSDERYRLSSAIDVDTIAGLVTLPLHQGLVGRRLVWHIVTESSDRADAERRGVTWSPRLAAISGSRATQPASENGGGLQYRAGVNFAPERAVVATAETGFPPSVATPGSVAEEGYSPFVTLPSGVVLNAPIVGDVRASLDRVERLDPASRTVRLRMSRGYANGETAWYITTDASDGMVAAMEGGTLAPALLDVPGAAGGDGSARTGLLAVINGERGVDNPERQGLESAMLDGRAPLSILEHVPDARDQVSAYTPAWDLHLVRWSKSAVRGNKRYKLVAWSEVGPLLESGSLTTEPPADPTDAAPARRTLRPARVVIDCPIIAVYARRVQ